MAKLCMESSSWGTACLELRKHDGDHVDRDGKKWNGLNQRPCESCRGRGYYGETTRNKAYATLLPKCNVCDGRGFLIDGPKPRKRKGKRAPQQMDLFGGKEQK